MTPEIKLLLKEIKAMYKTPYKSDHARPAELRKYYLRLFNLDDSTSVFVAINTKMDKVVSGSIIISGTNKNDTKVQGTIGDAIDLIDKLGVKKYIKLKALKDKLI